MLGQGKEVTVPEGLNRKRIRRKRRDRVYCSRITNNNGTSSYNSSLVFPFNTSSLLSLFLFRSSTVKLLSVFIDS